MVQAVWDDDPTLEVGRKGKTYIVNEPGHAAALTIHGIIAGTITDEAEGVEGWRLILGDTLDQMLADDVPDRFVGRVGLAALALFIHGDSERAKQIIEVGLDPEALAAPEAATSDKPKRAASPRSSSTGAARKTRSRASGTGTTSPKAD